MVDIETEKITDQMSSQTTRSPVRGFFGQAAEVTGDAIELAELQVRLAKADAAKAVKLAVLPIAVIAACGVVLLASLPVLLIAIAGFIARWTEISPELSQMLVSGIVAGLAVIASLVSLRQLKSAPHAFSRSTEELKYNLIWLKSIFRSSNS